MQNATTMNRGDASRARRFPRGARVTVEALAGDPYPLFHELRAAEPVTWVPELGMWMLTRRDDIVEVLADWKRFTTDAPASTIRDIFGSHMLTTDGEPQIRYKRRFIGPFRRGNLERNLLGTVRAVLDRLMESWKTVGGARPICGPGWRGHCRCGASAGCWGFRNAMDPACSPGTTTSPRRSRTSPAIPWCGAGGRTRPASSANT